MIQCVFRIGTGRSDFREARISGGDFGRAVLARSRFGGAKLKTADFRGADLTGARELTGEQLLQTLTDEATVLPNGKRGPYMRNSGAERAK